MERKISIHVDTIEQCFGCAGTVVQVEEVCMGEGEEKLALYLEGKERKGLNWELLKM